MFNWIERKITLSFLSEFIVRFTRASACLQWRYWNAVCRVQRSNIVVFSDEEEPRAAEEKKQSAKKAGKSKSGKNNAENADDAELEISDEEEDEVEENDDAEMDPSLDVDEQVLQALDDLSSEADEAWVISYSPETGLLRIHVSTIYWRAWST